MTQLPLSLSVSPNKNPDTSLSHQEATGQSGLSARTFKLGQGVFGRVAVVMVMPVS